MPKPLGINFLTADQLDQHVAKYDILKVFDDVMADTNQRVDIITHPDRFEAKIKSGTTEMPSSEILMECWNEEEVVDYAWSFIYRLRRTLEDWRSFDTIPTDGTTVLVKQGATIGAYYFEERPEQLFYDDGRAREPFWKGVIILSEFSGAAMHHPGGSVTPLKDRFLEVEGLDEDETPVLWKPLPPCFATPE